MKPILLIGLANSNQDYLDAIQAELEGIREALTKARQGGRVEIDERNQFTFKTLAEEFNDLDKSSRLAILHYSGHSSAAGLMLRQGGQDVLWNKEHLSAFLSAQNGLKLVFLNSCYSKTLAEALVAAGVPIVIGTSSAVKDKMAAAVAAYFYQTLGGSSKTIQQAFDLTMAYFDQLPPVDDLSFRGPIADLDDAPWNIYIAPDKAEVAGWRLIPLSILDKLPAVQGKRKLLLLMDSEQQQEDYHKGILNFLVDYPEIHPISIWEFQQDDAPNREAVLNQIDVVLYLATPGLKTALEKELDWVKGHLDKNKPHGILACEEPADDLKNYLNEKNLIEASSKLIPNGIVISALLNNGNNTTVILQSLLKEKILEILGTHKMDSVLKKAFNSLNFKNQRKLLDLSSSHYFILIEGTQDSGQELLVRTILEDPLLNIPNNVKALNISLRPAFGATDLDENRIWSAIIDNLKFNATTIKEIILNLKARLSEEDIVIVLNDISKQKQENLKQVLESFWKNLNQYFPNDKTRGRFILFFVHKGYEKDNCCLKCLEFTGKNEPINVQILPPILELDGEELDIWHIQERRNLPANHKFVTLLQNHRQQILDKKQIKGVVEEICDLMQVPIAHEVLKF